VLGLLLRWIIGAITLFVIAYFVPGFHIWPLSGLGIDAFSRPRAPASFPTNTSVRLFF